MCVECVGCMWYVVCGVCVCGMWSVGCVLIKMCQHAHDQYTNTHMISILTRT